jgi:DNA-binding response OmpR family regulator
MAKNKAVLVIDDEPDFVEAIRMRLEAGGYEVIGALDGNDGFEKARKMKPALIFLDLVMPQPNGFEVLNRLKSDFRTMGIPVIILTAKTDKEYMVDAKTLGAADYLVKPPGMDAITDLVKKYVKSP